MTDIDRLPGPELGIPPDNDNSWRAWSPPSGSIGESSSKSASLLRLLLTLYVESIRLLLVVHALLIIVVLEDTSLAEV